MSQNQDQTTFAAPETFAVERNGKETSSLDVLRGVQSVADALQISYWLANRLIRRGELPGRYIGGETARAFTTSRRALASYFENAGLPHDR